MIRKRISPLDRKLLILIQQENQGREIKNRELGRIARRFRPSKMEIRNALKEMERYGILERRNERKLLIKRKL